MASQVSEFKTVSFRNSSEMDSQRAERSLLRFILASICQDLVHGTNRKGLFVIEEQRRESHVEKFGEKTARVHVLRQGGATGPRTYICTKVV